jgi:DNA polymerase III subunit chi
MAVAKAVQVSFYSDAADPLHFACRLLRRALGSGKAVGVCAPPRELARLDELLWRFEPTEFIPHRRASQAAAPGEVLLVSDASELPHRELLLNLGAELPADALAFERVLEVVGQPPEDVRAGRERYRIYKQAGAQLDHFTAGR